jgi:sarcosine oxidase/L-pipecolate oxidase
MKLRVVGGGRTPSVLPEVAGLLETTAGSVCTISLPKDRTDLWDKVRPALPVLERSRSDAWA